MTGRTQVKLTYEDYLLIPNDGKRHELLDGDHFMTPSPRPRHQRIVGNLYYAFRSYLAQHPVGEVFIAPLDVVMSPHDVCEPDIVFVSNDQASIVTPMNIQGVPTLVVEVLSDGSRKLDETYKRDRYGQAGIKDYWIVDPEVDLVKVLRLGDRGYVQPIELRLERNDELTSPLLAAFRLPLTMLFG